MTDETKNWTALQVQVLCQKRVKYFVGRYEADWLRRELREGGVEFSGLDCMIVQVISFHAGVNNESE